VTVLPRASEIILKGHCGRLHILIERPQHGFDSSTIYAATLEDLRTFAEILRQ